LATVHGACELGVTAVWTVGGDALPATDGATTPGRRYLLERQAQLTASEARRARAMQLADGLERAAAGSVRRTERQVAPSSDVALSLALLVDRAAAAEVSQKLRAQVHHDVRILVHGPWPPYTFADFRSSRSREQP
jgi:hypothetical protein